MKNRATIWILVLLSLFVSSKSVAQVLFDLPDGLSACNHLKPLDDEIAFVLIESQALEGGHISHLKKIGMQGELSNVTIENSVPIQLFLENELVTIIYEQNGNFYLSQFDLFLNLIQTVDLAIQPNSHYYNSLLLQDELFIVTNNNGFVQLNLLNLEGDMLASFSMDQITLAYPSYMTTLTQLDDENVLLSLQCDRTSIIDLNNMELAAWNSNEFMGCFESTMVYNEAVSGTVASLSSYSPIGSQFTEIILSTFDEETESVNQFFISDETDLVHVDAQIKEDESVLLIGLRLEYEDGFTSNTDVVLYELNLDGSILTTFNLGTPTLREYATRFEETENQFWFYGSQGENANPEEYEAYVLRVSKEEVFTAIEDDDLHRKDIYSFVQTATDVRLSSLNNEVLSYQLIDMNGRMIRTNEGVEIAFSKNALAQGIYFVRIVADGTAFTERIVVSR